MLATLDSITKLRLGTLLWTWGVFLVTLFLLSKIAWPMLIKKMEEREVRISEGLKKAEEAEAHARELAERQEQILEEARREAQQFLAESRESAEHARNEMLAATQDEIAAQRERAKREIELERANAIEELKTATVGLTLDASSRLLQRELHDDDHERMAREVVEEVASRL
ncbi:MAG TPA: F0F1 ATP synthase subunit B [Acidimicrobiales bacterium]|jgi:F-type H+-transporting ATPase subunit b|nr:F0F1 ATP synthase subunit B [Acidimicrobiales bacterium]